MSRILAVSLKVLILREKIYRTLAFWRPRFEFKTARDLASTLYDGSKGGRDAPRRISCADGGEEGSPTKSFGDLGALPRMQGSQGASQCN